ncbi:MAG: T9SS type A sorting domain-containing protein, partial [bacterium]
KKQATPYQGPVFTLGPNPANPVVQVGFSLPFPQPVSVAIYNLLGQQVATLSSGQQPAGDHSYRWDASSYASGVYLIQMQTPTSSTSQRFVVVK